MEKVLTVVVAAIIFTLNCTPVTSPTPAESTVIYADAFITVYHLTYRGHEVIVSSQGGVVELTSNPFDTYKEGGK